jgi:hypothetical protein
MTELKDDPTAKQYTYDAQSKPPPFGRSLLPYFGIDPDYTNLNNGVLVFIQYSLLFCFLAL